MNGITLSVFIFLIFAAVMPARPAAAGVMKGAVEGAPALPGSAASSIAPETVCLYVGRLSLLADAVIPGNAGTSSETRTASIETPSLAEEGSPVSGDHGAGGSWSAHTPPSGISDGSKDPSAPPSLSEVIAAAEEGSAIVLGPGVYKGPVAISKRIALKAREKGTAVIIGDGKGSVITVTASGASLEGLAIRASGESHEAADACVAVKDADGVKIIGNRLEDCLFGINFEGSNRGEIGFNEITSKDFSLGLKGDGIRLWYSHGNLIEGNRMKSVRDMVFWYSSGNTIRKNEVEKSRYSLHFMYADRNFVENNFFKDNSVGIFLMYSHGSRIEGNAVTGSSGAFGIGIGFKEVSDCVVTGNVLTYNGRGFYLDQSPYQPGSTNEFKRNGIYYNAVGVQFHGITIGSVFEENAFLGNIDTISNDTPSSDLSVNLWSGNSWDEYAGFDRDRDGWGDLPFESVAYADRIMDYRPSVKFFYGSPVMSLLNFLSKLMPFSDPVILARDPKPAAGRRAFDEL